MLLRLFPPPRYELPDDVVFEASGVLQVFAAALASARALGFARALRGAARGRPRPGGPERARLAAEPPDAEVPRSQGGLVTPR
jgi:hypothetical protein